MIVLFSKCDILTDTYQNMFSNGFHYIFIYEKQNALLEIILRKR